MPARSTLPLLKPTAPQPGAAISVISPASFANSDRFDRGIQALHSLGHHPHSGANTQARGPLFFAGSREQRLSDFHSAFVDPETAIVAAARGGYGSNYLLDGIDLELIRKHPKPFFAYSDLTGIQLHLLDLLGLPAFHGPMVAADFAVEDGVHLASFQAALAGNLYNVGENEGLRPLKTGTARGTLYGGCLSILVALIGTPWEPATENKLLFLEDTGAKPYQVDRMLWQLRHAGKFDGVTGIIFGEMLDCASPSMPPEFLEQVIATVFDDFDRPIAIGLRSGHVSRHNVTLVFGVNAELSIASHQEPRLRLEWG